jgi:hypothetical protein
MGIIPKGPMPVEMASALRERLEEAINTPKLCMVVTIDDAGNLLVYRTWNDPKLDYLLAASLLKER